MIINGMLARAVNLCGPESTGKPLRGVVFSVRSLKAVDSWSCYEFLGSCYAAKAIIKKKRPVASMPRAFYQVQLGRPPWTELSTKKAVNRSGGGSKRNSWVATMRTANGARAIHFWRRQYDKADPERRRHTPLEASCAGMRRGRSPASSRLSIRYSRFANVECGYELEASRRLRSAEDRR